MTVLSRILRLQLEARRALDQTVERWRRPRGARRHRRPEDGRAVISEGMTRFGRIDTLVNTAGIFIAKRLTQYTEADYSAILGVNTAGFFHTTQFAIAEMEKQDSGHVVQITTSLVDHAIAGVPCVLAALTKGALNAALNRSRSSMRSAAFG
jgi:NADP-dependent 3-hydroxy acid dehydrogenase YdfG